MVYEGEVKYEKIFFIKLFIYFVIFEIFAYLGEKKLAEFKKNDILSRHVYLDEKQKFSIF